MRAGATLEPFWFKYLAILMFKFNITNFQVGVKICFFRDIILKKRDDSYEK